MSLGDKHLTDGTEDPKERTPPIARTGWPGVSVPPRRWPRPGGTQAVQVGMTPMAAVLSFGSRMADIAAAWPPLSPPWE